ncbi:hypothetical protein [Catenuloplanes atrovinosus]|uniref:Uncharacterized protein n=1 Tax=Catenuloplanes atrovinosus TaxID=137266 RepID=A0AAE4C6Y3_9ACTN|nr:hypothetical protein [Catenuloplanes atrovinosus]MDR7274001.1 hypothetical protein [Catenuloplanes atrovinosus]
MTVTAAIAFTDSCPTLLSSTVIAGWRRRLARDRHRERSHWRTKTAYYRAADTLLRDGAGRTPGWRDVVGTVLPQGSRTTFYEVAGEHARHPMMRDLTRDGSADSIQLALVYRRDDAVAQLIDETKVWSFWEYREELVRRFVAEMPGPDEAGREVRAALLAWAADHPELAAALDHAPPACTVEDLVVLGRGRAMAMRVERELAALLHAR